MTTEEVRQKLYEVCDVAEHHPKKFDIYTVIDHGCATVACIAGWLCILDDPATFTQTHLDVSWWAGSYSEELDVGRAACRILGLDTEWVPHLFLIHHWPTDLQNEYKYRTEDDDSQLHEILRRVVDWWISEEMPSYKLYP